MGRASNQLHNTMGILCVPDGIFVSKHFLKALGAANSPAMLTNNPTIDDLPIVLEFVFEARSRLFFSRHRSSERHYGICAKI